MKNYLVFFLTLTLIACGPSQEEIKRAEMEQQRIEQEVAEQLAAENATRVAAVTCAIMSETRNMDEAVRVREMNAAREKIGGEPFLRGDAVIKESFEYGLCEELVLDAARYDESLGFLKDLEQQQERIAAEKRAEEKRIAAEKQRIADSKPIVKEEFYPNGELKERTNYSSKSEGEKRHGLHRSWSRDGRLRFERTYKDGKEHGLERWWHDNGRLRRETSYKDGEPHGLRKRWDEKGQMKSETCFSNNEIVDMSGCKE